LHTSRLLNPFSYQDVADDKLIVLDIRARDSARRWLNIEMQVSVFTGLLQRLVYYACSLYVDQLGWEKVPDTFSRPRQLTLES
jgi:predicted transposase/invertase (TIGR01784 family)